MNPKGPADKISMSDFLDQYAYKEEVQDVLEFFDMPVSGTKDELIRRLKKPLTTEKPRVILDILSKDSLKTACDHYDLPVGGNKDDLIDRVLKEIIAVPVKTKPTESDPAIPQAMNFERGQEHVTLRKWLDAHFDEKQMKEGCSRLGLPTKGSKDQLLDRLLIDTKYVPKRALAAWDYYTLNDMAVTLGIPSKRSKKEQIEEILKHEFGICVSPSTVQMSAEPKPHEVRMPIETTTVVNHVIKKSFDQATFDRLATTIASWTPSRTYEHESGYEAELSTWLKAKGYQTSQQKGDSLADIVVDDVYPIEIKKEPKMGDYDRAYGQIDRHCDAFGSVIIVMCNVKVNDQYLDFERRVNRALNGHPHYIIKK